MRNKVITTFFCLLLTVTVTAGIFLPDRYYSEREKRKLEQIPSWSVDAFFSGKFGDRLENYLSDQIPLRDQWVILKTYAELAIGKHESGGVYIGKDHYLMDRFDSFSEKQLQTNAQTLAALQKALEEMGIPMKTILVPTASQILTEKMPAYAPAADDKEIYDILKEAGVSLVEISDILREHADEDIYYRTDHHWTSLGAYYAYCVWCESNGVVPCSEEMWIKEVLSDSFRGTTWNKVQIPSVPTDSITAWYRRSSHSVSYDGGKYVSDSIYERKYLEGNDQYAVFLNSNQAQTVIQGDGENGKLLLIKDSYGNTFSQFTLENYTEVHVIDLRFFRGDLLEYAEENGITDVLTLYGMQNFSKDTSLALALA